MTWTNDSSEEIPPPRGKLSLYALADAKGAKFNRKDAVKGASQEHEDQEDEDDKGQDEEGQEATEASEEAEEYWTGEPVVYERNSIISF